MSRLQERIPINLIRQIYTRILDRVVLEPAMGFEPMTYGLRYRRSAAELRWHQNFNMIQDPDTGSLMIKF